MRTLAFEWTKFWSIRSTVFTLLAIGMLPPVLAVFVAATESLQPDDTILGASLTAAVTVQLIAAVLGALTMTSEYAAGTLHPTLLAQPHRLKVLVAKATVVSAVLFAVTLVSCTGAFVVGLVTLDRTTYAVGEPWPALLGVAGMMSLSGLLGLAIGTTLRRSAGAIGALVGLILLPSLLAPLFGDLQRWVAGAAPAAGLQKLTQTSDATPEAVGQLGGWPSLVVVACYVLAALVGSGHVLQARDA